MFVSAEERKESTMNEIRLNLAPKYMYILYTYIYTIDPFVRWTIVVTQFNTIRLYFFFFLPFFFLTFTLSTSPLFVSKPLQSFYRQIQEKNLSMVLEKYSSFLYIYILDRFNFSSIAYLDRSKLLHPLLPCDLFSKGVSQQDFDPNDHVERLDSRKRQFSRRLQFNPADVSTCRIILRYYITSFRLRDADISRHGCTFQFVRQIRSFRLNRGI